MTDQIDQITDTDVEEIEETDGGSGRGRRLFLTGAGIAGVAAFAGKSGVAQAADGEVFTGSTTTYINNEAGGATPGDEGGEAIVGDNTNAANGSHTIRGNTNGIGHAIAGTVPADNENNAVAATWGKHDNGLGAGIGGVNGATDVDIAGPARGVEGIVFDASNGSHAVYGEARGGGHSVAGDTPEDAAGPGGIGPNTTAATWGRHNGIGAGIGGVSANGYGGEFVGGRASVRLIPSDPAPGATTNPGDDDSQVGELIVDSEGGLWYNAVAGANFKRLSEQQNTFDDSVRAFDSREGNTPVTDNQGRLESGTVREISLVDAGVPAGASANVNITVTNTGTIGFLTVFNGDTDDDDRPNTSAITWDNPAQRTSNSTSVRTSADGTIKVYAESDTEMAIDVTGFTS